MSIRALVLLLMLVVAPAYAVDPGERLADPGQEARARRLSAELRCLVCQNQSIDDSNAPLAKDLRVLVREQIKTGKSDDDVLKFIVQRYGEFVLLRPPFGMSTLLLWLAPLLLLTAAIAVITRQRRVTATAPPPLSPDEQRRLDAILRDKT